jgi:hypothetical protein
MFYFDSVNLVSVFHINMSYYFEASWNYYYDTESGWDPISEAEHSILVSKVPATSTRPQTPGSHSAKKVASHDKNSTAGNFQGISASAVSPGNYNIGLSLNYSKFII